MHRYIMRIHYERRVGARSCMSIYPPMINVLFVDLALIEKLYTALFMQVFHLTKFKPEMSMIYRYLHCILYKVIIYPNLEILTKSNKKM